MVFYEWRAHSGRKVFSSSRASSKTTTRRNVTKSSVCLIHNVDRDKPQQKSFTHRSRNQFKSSSAASSTRRPPPHDQRPHRTHTHPPLLLLTLTLPARRARRGFLSLAPFASPSSERAVGIGAALVRGVRATDERGGGDGERGVERTKRHAVTATSCSAGRDVRAFPSGCAVVKLVVVVLSGALSSCVGASGCFDDGS